MPISDPFGYIGFTVLLSVGINNGMLIQKYNSSSRGRDGRYTRRGTVKVKSHI